MNNHQGPIVVVGSINLDLVVTSQRVPVAGETLTGRQFQTHPGGKGANQAVAAARLGYPVRMVGRLGTDSFGRELRTHLDHAGVDTSAVQSVEGASGVALIIVEEHGENCIVVVPGANAQVTSEYVDSQWEYIRDAGMVLAQLEIPLETIEHLAHRCSHSGIPFMLDPAPARALPPKLLSYVTWFTPNETEAAFYTPAYSTSNTDPGQAARLFLTQGATNVILKMGSRGAWLAAPGIDRQVPAITVNAVDTTAAGDAFNGAFAVALMRGNSPVESARFATAAAACSVTRHGAQPSMPTLGEVESLLAVIR